MARTIFRCDTLVEGTGASVDEIDVMPDCSRDGQGTPLSWNAQTLGAGHQPIRSIVAGNLIGWERIPPRAFSSTGSGHGGRMQTPEWPLGRTWDGLNTLGGTLRLRYIWDVGFCIASVDSLNWGPAAIGLRSSPNSLDVSNTITGLEIFIGQKTGDGSLFPNPGFEDGWRFRTRKVALSALDTAGFGVGAGEVAHHLRIVYLDSDEPQIRVFVNGLMIYAEDGSLFDPDSYGPAVEGSMLTFCSTRTIDELSEGEDPWADESNQVLIVNSDEENIVKSDETTPISTAE